MDLQLLRSIDLFHNLNPVQLSHLASIAQEVSARKGKVLFEEGDKAEQFYVVTKGRIRISKMVPGIGEEALAFIETGSYFGEMELIDDTLRRAARASVHEDATLQAFPITEFHSLLSSDRDLALSLLWSMVRTLSHRLRNTNDKVTAMFAMAQFK